MSKKYLKPDEVSTYRDLGYTIHEGERKGIFVETSSRNNDNIRINVANQITKIPYTDEQLFKNPDDIEKAYGRVVSKICEDLTQIVPKYKSISIKRQFDETIISVNGINNLTPSITYSDDGNVLKFNDGYGLLTYDKEAGEDEQEFRKQFSRINKIMSMKDEILVSKMANMGTISYSLVSLPSTEKFMERLMKKGYKYPVSFMITSCEQINNHTIKNLVNKTNSLDKTQYLNRIIGGLSKNVEIKSLYNYNESAQGVLRTIVTCLTYDKILNGNLNIEIDEYNVENKSAKSFYKNGKITLYDDLDEINDGLKAGTFVYNSFMVYLQDMMRKRNPSIYGLYNYKMLQIYKDIKQGYAPSVYSTLNERTGLQSMYEMIFNDKEYIENDDDLKQQWKNGKIDSINSMNYNINTEWKDNINKSQIKNLYEIGTLINELYGIA